METEIRTWVQVVSLEVTPESRREGAGRARQVNYLRVYEPGHGYGKQELNSAVASLESSRISSKIVLGDRDIHPLAFLLVLKGRGLPSGENSLVL